MSGSSSHHEHRIDVESLCRHHGVHWTTQRKLVWEFFAGASRRYSISEAVAALKPKGVGQATVYRTIELLTELGLLIHTQDAANRSLYMAVCPGHTHALICSACRTVVEFDDCDLSLLEKLLSARTGFHVEGHRLEVYGTCPSCSSPAKARSHA